MNIWSDENLNNVGMGVDYPDLMLLFLLSLHSRKCITVRIVLYLYVQDDRVIAAQNIITKQGAYVSRVMERFPYSTQPRGFDGDEP